jgi:hypothetical protein
MIHVASRATRTIDIPKRKQTREEIISLFKAQMIKLKDRLNVLCLVSFCSDSNVLNLSL